MRIAGFPLPHLEARGNLRFVAADVRGPIELIRGWGLEEFYELRDVPGEEVSEESVEATKTLMILGCSDTRPRWRWMLTRSEPLLKSTLAISGLHCAACMWLIERAPERIDGWHSVGREHAFANGGHRVRSE